MPKKHLFTSFILCCFSICSYSQLCQGSLGDPIAEINFGSGTGTGGPLGSSITAFTYNNNGELDEGEYVISSSSSGLKRNAWHATSDHTGNSNGYMMVINSAVLADEGVFYTKTVSGLCPNTTYEFSAWLMNLLNPNVGLTDQYSPNVTFRISDTSGSILGSYNTGSIAQTSSGAWIQYGFFFTLITGTEVVITILNTAPSAHPGNDIALDDIAFKPCGPTITNTINGSSLSSITSCQDETINYTLETSLSSGYPDPRYQWQYSDDNGSTWIDITGETSENLLVTNSSAPGTFLYRVAIANGDNINSSSCRIVSNDFIIEILDKPAPLTGATQQSFCSTQNATLENIEINSSVAWYDTLTKDILLPENTTLIDGRTYYASQISNGCESDEVLSVSVSLYSPTLEIHNIEASVCDNLNDNNEMVDLSIYAKDITDCNDCEFIFFLTETDAQNHSENGLIPSDYLLNSTKTVLYARVESSDNCYQIAKLTLNLQETPTVNISDYIGICEGDNDKIIDAGFGFDGYSWSTGDTSQTITISSEDHGTYWVEVTKNYGSYTCSSSQEYFEVDASNTAIISSIDIDDWTDNENSITITLSNLSLGDYEYSLDNITYQANNVFIGLSPGEYTLFIRDKKGCDTLQEPFYILNFPKYFTPNNDGLNDTWSIEYSENVEPTMTINIYNRYGKLIKFLNGSSSWDGTCNGSKMPTSDYWFVVTRANGKNHMGHFTLKR